MFPCRGAPNPGWDRQLDASRQQRVSARPCSEYPLTHDPGLEWPAAWGRTEGVPCYLCSAQALHLNPNLLSLLLWRPSALAHPGRTWHGQLDAGGQRGVPVRPGDGQECHHDPGRDPRARLAHSGPPAFLSVHHPRQRACHCAQPGGEMPLNHTSMSLYCVTVSLCDMPVSLYHAPVPLYRMTVPHACFFAWCPCIACMCACPIRLCRCFVSLCHYVFCLCVACLHVTTSYACVTATSPCIVRMCHYVQYMGISVFASYVLDARDTASLVSIFLPIAGRNLWEPRTPLSTHPLF